MTGERCLHMLREIKSAAFATVDHHGLPKVRIIDIMLVENEKLYFCTARGKNFYQELILNGHTAITGLNREFQMIRLEGPVKRLSEQKRWIDRIFEENPVMNGVYPGESRYILEAFCIENGEIEYFNLGNDPVERGNFIVGEGKKRSRGFRIQDTCIRCGSCGEQCPQQCIISGNPYAIRQENCLFCGLCYEICPVKAIRKMEVE